MESYIFFFASLVKLSNTSKSSSQFIIYTDNKVRLTNIGNIYKN
jgi:hypothetical protein